VHLSLLLKQKLYYKSLRCFWDSPRRVYYLITAHSFVVRLFRLKCDATSSKCGTEWSFKQSLCREKVLPFNSD